VLKHIQEDYVGRAEHGKVRAAALRGLAYGLDPYSTYLTLRAGQGISRGQQEQSGGLGAELSQVASFLYVVAPVKVRRRIKPAFTRVTSLNISTARPRATFLYTTRDNYSTAPPDPK